MALLWRRIIFLSKRIVVILHPKSPTFCGHFFPDVVYTVYLRVYFLALRSGSGSRIEIPSFVRLSWRFVLPFGGTKVLLVGVTSWFHPSWSRSYYEVECSMFHVLTLLLCWLLLWFVASVPPSFLHRIFFRATRSYLLWFGWNAFLHWVFYLHYDSHMRLKYLLFPESSIGFGCWSFPRNLFLLILHNLGRDR
jgi:hypothetical protein